jgi:hypothetical protein
MITVGDYTIRELFAGRCMKNSIRIAVFGGQKKGGNQCWMQSIRAGVVSFACPGDFPGEIATSLAKGEVYWS